MSDESQDRPPIDLNWLYTLVWLVFCGIGVGFVAGIVASIPAEWFTASRDFIEAMTWTSPFLFY